jgi:arginase family enzyme
MNLCLVRLMYLQALALSRGVNCVLLDVREVLASKIQKSRIRRVNGESLMNAQTNWKHLKASIILMFIIIPMAVPHANQWSLPKDLANKVSKLQPEQQAFITSGEALNFLPERQLIHEINNRSSDSMQALVDDLMAAAVEMSYDPTRDMGAMPLNLTTQRFNPNIVTPAPLRGLKRDDGPFSISRYMFPTSGISTFAGAKVAVYPEDLVAGKVDVAIIGIPSDMSSGRRNAGYGPRYMRAMNTIATRDLQSLLDPMEVLSIVDYGNFFVDNMSGERSTEHITAMVAETASTNAVPMMVGGDTSILYPAVKGIARFKGVKSFGLVHFSAHPDAELQSAHIVSDSQTISKLITEGIVEGNDVIQIGLRGQAVDVSTLKWLSARGVKYYTMAAVNLRGFAKVLTDIKKEARKGPDQLFVSIDVSVIEPTEMVSAGRIASNGLRVQQVTEAIRYLCAAKEIVGFEITDMSPMLDYSRLSAVNANAILNACLVGVAVRKAGLKPEYIHPLALSHGN